MVCPAWYAFSFRACLLVALTGWLAPLEAAPRLAGKAGSGLPVVFHAAGNGDFMARGGTGEARISASRLQLRQSGSTLEVRYEGARSAARVEACGSAGAQLNFLIGNQPEAWRTNVPGYECVATRGLYDGIDLQISAQGGNLKSEFQLAAGADPRQIRLRYEPAAAIAVEPDGSLRVETAAGDWREDAPLLYQQIAGQTVRVEGRFSVLPDGSVGFEVGDYDATQRLVIDPVLTFSTPLGGTGISTATGVAVGSDGTIYVAGYSDAADLPVQSPVLSRASSVEIYVAHIQPSTGRLLYASYIGGSGDDRAFGIAVDSTGAVYLTGWTTSTNFPTASPYQASSGGGKDAFLLKLGVGGSSLIYSTYYGGTSSDAGNAIALSGSSVWIAGDTSSTSLPGVNGWKTTKGALQDGFVARFTSAGLLAVSSYVGGSGTDTIRALAVDSAGNVYVGGGTDSNNLTLPMGALMPSQNGGQDGFIIKLDASGTQELAGTYLGGLQGSASYPEKVMALAVDSLQNVYAAGLTPSYDFPTATAWQSALSGMQDGFAVKLNSAMSNMMWGSYIGGSGDDTINAALLDSTGGLVLAGTTTSSDLVVQSGVQAQNYGAADGLLARVAAGGTGLTMLSYLGGSAADGLNALALTASGSLVVGGQSGSADLATLNPSQTLSGSVLRMSVARVAMGDVPSPQGFSYSAGTPVVFSASYYAGGAQISMVEALVADSVVSAGACPIRYRRDTGALYLADDTGLYWAAVRMGTADTARNSQCQLNGTGSSLAQSDNALTVTASVSFIAGFTGLKQSFVNAANAAGEESGFVSMGAVTITGSANAAPAVLSVSPGSGSGASGTFTFRFSDANGGSDIYLARMLFSSQMQDAASCSVSVDRVHSRVRLVNDAGTAALTAVTLGSASVIENSQCQVRMAGTSVSVSGTTLTVVLDVVFKSAFAGTKAIYAAATDMSGAGPYWTPVGTFTVSMSVANQAPAPLSLTPSSGSGSAGTFTFTFLDANGGTDIYVTHMLFNTQATEAVGCAVHFNRVSNQIYLVNDTGTATLAPGVPGTSGTLDNAQCQVRLATSSVSAVGNSLTVVLDVGFKAAFAGAKSVYAAATDTSGASSYWRVIGSWTVLAAQANQAPTAVSVTPASGSGNRQVFTAVYSDGDGALDVASARLLVNSTFQGGSGCYVVLNRAARVIYLANDAGTSWAPIQVGNAESASNSQCTVYAATSTFSAIGTSFSMSVDIGFKSAFAGAKSLWLNATDASGQSSAWPQLGTFTVTP